MGKSMLFLLGIFAVLLVSGCTQTGQVTNVNVDTGPGAVKECPASCDDGNECTADLCDEHSDFECRNVPRWGVECGENGICQDGVCVEMTDNCSHITDSADKEQCYFKDYYIPARRGDNVLICDGIADDTYMARCYAYAALGGDDPVLCEGLEEQESRDECYAFYAEGKADIFIFAEESCKRIVDLSMKAECLALEELVTAAVGIRDLAAEVGSDKKIYSYFTLKDAKGRVTTAGGNASVLIINEGDEDDGVVKLFSRTYEVKEENFEMFRPGLGAEVLSFVIPPIEPREFEDVVKTRSGTFFLTFATDDGKYFSRQAELVFKD
jgi:hypothetical protein